MFGKKKDAPIIVQSPLIESVIDDHPRMIRYEITKQKIKMSGNVQEYHRVVIKRGKIDRSKEWIVWPKKKVLFHNSLSEMSYELKRKTEKLVFDMAYAEPFNDDNRIVWSPVVEKGLINQSFDDYSDVVAITGFELTPRHIAIMIVVAALFVPFGLSMNSFFHLVSNVNVHWLPSNPFHK